MKLPLAISIGFRYARAGRRRGMMSFLSSISMAGLIVGVSLLVLVVSVMNGFERELRERILSLVPQAAIYHVGGIDNWTSLRERLRAVPGVVDAAPFIQINALISKRRRANPALMYGIDLPAEAGVSLLGKFIDEKASAALTSNNKSIVLGVDLAKKIGVVAGDKVLVIVPAASDSGTSPQFVTLTVVQLLHTATELDQTLAIVNLTSARTLAGLPSGSVDGLRLKLRDLFAAPEIAYRCVLELGPEYFQSNWTRTHGNLYHAIRVSKNMVVLLMSLIVALAAFNVVSTLILVVMEKQTNIAILRTLGASSQTILGVFITQGMLIGIGGVGAGIAIGCVLSLALQRIVGWLERVGHVQFLHSDVYPLTYIPAQILPSDLLEIALISFVLVFLATLYPAWKAVRLQPADALRYE